MKQSVFLLLAAFLVTGLYLENHAQKLILKFNNGDENAEQLNSIQKLFFSGDELVVDFKTGSDDVYAMADIRKLYFDAAVSVNELTTDRSHMAVYPNPAGDMITVKDIPVKEGMFRIFMMDGRVILGGNIHHDQTEIDVSGLPDGLYLFNVEGYTTKFVKK